MSYTVTLIAIRGPLAGRKFVFSGPTSCHIGRSRDCTICLPQEVEHLDVSRHHCVIEIDPPSLLVRDLGSLNGTYVNGKKIGQRITSPSSRFAESKEFPAVSLVDGDVIQLGERTVFRISFLTPERENIARKARCSSGEFRLPEPVPS